MGRYSLVLDGLTGGYMASFAAWFVGLYHDFLAWIVDLFSGLFDWLKDILLWLAKTIFSSMMDGLASLVESIPVPDFMAQAGSFFGNLPTGVVYFLHYFAVSEGLAFIISALLLRFILRRIPFIG